MALFMNFKEAAERDGEWNNRVLWLFETPSNFNKNLYKVQQKSSLLLTTTKKRESRSLGSCWNDVKLGASYLQRIIGQNKNSITRCNFHVKSQETQYSIYSVHTIYQCTHYNFHEKSPQTKSGIKILHGLPWWWTNALVYHRLPWTEWWIFQIFIVVIRLDSFVQ